MTIMIGFSRAEPHAESPFSDFHRPPTMIKKYQYNEDLFEDTKMTFGEHLEELRKCLWKALLGLAIGMAIGLLFANEVVLFIQTPLQDALSKYYKDRSKTKLTERYGDLKNVPAAVGKRLERSQVIFEEVLVDPVDMARSLGIDQADKKAAGDKSVGGAGQATAGAAEDAQSGEDPFAGLEPIYLWRPTTEDPRISLKSLSAQETFMIWLKAGFVFGTIISAPWVFYQIWNFVAAGLYPHERKYVYVFLPFSLGLFLAGALLAFFIVFQFVLRFLFSFNAAMGIDPDPRISEWLSFVILMPLMFGISFQLPLVMLFLERIGVFTVASYMSKWRIAVLVIAVLSMILSPGGDPMSMMLMFIPLVGLFFLGVWMCHYMREEKGIGNQVA
jgi:sec-independent protein translocase protein TatC